jgi:hypothetical protein
MDNTPYCKICDSCGEELCCSPTSCKQHPEGEYCDIYLAQLKVGYKMYEYLINKIYKELSEDVKQEIDEKETELQKTYLC